MSRKKLSAVITAVATLAGSLGYMGGTAELEPDLALEEATKRLDRLEERTAIALESIDERLTKMAGRR